MKKLSDTFEEDWTDQVCDLSVMADDYEMNAVDREYFLSYRIRGDARHYYNHLTTRNATWTQMLLAFNESYF